MRFPEFSGEWEEHTLSEYLEFKNGLNPDAKRIGSGLPFISVMDILSEGVINYDNIRGKVNATEKEIECFGVKDGDLLFQRSSETLEDVGRANVYMDNRTAIYGGFVIRGRKIGNYDPLFFKYLLATPLARKRTCRMGAGAQHFNIGQEGLSKISLYFPSIEEQRKIAEFLSLIDERIATQNKIIEDLKLLRDAISGLIFNSMKNEKTILLGNVACISNGSGDVQDSDSIKRDGWYPFFDRSEEQKWFPTYSFNREAIIYAGEGQNFFPRYYKGKFALHQRCYAITDFCECLLPKYCLYFMNTLNSYFIRNAVGSTVPSLRMDMFQKAKIKIPTIERQQEIVSTLDALSLKCENEEIVRALYNTQKSYLLQQLFI